MDVLEDRPREGAAREVAEAEFEKRWRGAGHWTLLVLPGEPAPPQ